MRIKPPPSHVQTSLFDLIPDKAFAGPGSVRTHSGAVVEAFVCSILGLTPLGGGGCHDIVFDAHGHGSYCEIKSLHRTGSLPLYEWRRDKDRDCGVPLVYAVAVHSCRGAQTLGDLWVRMSSSIKEILVVPGWAVDLLAHTLPLRHIVKQNQGGARAGYSRSGYCNGYRNIPLNLIRSLSYHNPVEAHSEHSGLPLDSFVRFHKSLTPWRV